MDDEVNLRSATITIEEHAARFSSVAPLFCDFRNHPGFENRTAKRMRAQLIGCANAHEPANEAGVVEMQLGRLHEALPKVRMIRRQAENDEAGLEQADPGFRGRLRYAAIAGQRGVVQQLRRTSGAQLHESLEERKIFDIAERSHVALDVGGDIGAEPVGRIEAAIEYGGIGADEQSLFEALGIPAETLGLPARKRKQTVHRSSAGERLGNRFQKGEVLGAGENPSPGFRLVVDDA